MNFAKIKLISLLFFIAFALFMFLVFRTYIINKQHDSVDVNINNTKQYIIKSIEYLINEKKETYLNTASIIFSDKKILNALTAKKRNIFYSLTKPYYDRVKKRDKNFWGLHIILSDNMSFIRVHKPHVADKLIEKGKKPLIDQVNTTLQPVTSFEAGKFGYFLRVVYPIFSQDKKYLGLAEFSVNVNSLAQYIKSTFGYESLFLVDNINNKKFLSTLPKTKNNLTMFKSTNIEFFTSYKSNNPYEHHENLAHDLISNNDKYFSTVLIKLSKTASLVVAFDTTTIIKEHFEFTKNITTLTLIVIFIFAVIWIIASKLYIKNKKQVISQLQESHDILSENVIYSITDLKGIITEVSDAYCQLTGYTRNELIGKTHNIHNHPDTKKTVYEDLWHTISANKTWKGEIKNLNPDGSFYWVEITISPKFDANHNKIGYMSIQQNISDRKIIEINSITDSLCGIYNRRHFDDLFPKLINIAKRKNEQICFLIMDVDYFKQYNDIYGHQMGDTALKNISTCLKNSLHRADDYCFRLGGEEFGLIFKTDSKEMALDYANKIRVNIENLKIPHDASNVSKYITASFGLVCKHANEIYNADEIYKEADNLLYKAKHSNRNQVMVNT